jgi:hypothetical protein
MILTQYVAFPSTPGFQGKMFESPGITCRG